MVCLIGSKSYSQGRSIPVSTIHITSCKANNGRHYGSEIEDLPGEGDRIRQAIAGAHEYLDDPALYASGRGGVGGCAGFDRLTRSPPCIIRRVFHEPFLLME